MISISTSGISYRIGDREILKDITFAIEEGDRLAVVGVNGSGKSTLLNIIYGDYEASSGSVFIAKDKSVGMLHQNDAFNIIGNGDEDSPINGTVLGQMYAVFAELVEMEGRLQNIQNQLDSDGLSYETATRLSAEYSNLNSRYISEGGLYFRSRCCSILKNLGFDESFWQMQVTSLSGGQRTRLALARLLFREPDILILDEPTNHLDVETMEWLESHLAAYGKTKTVILVSHDRMFLDRVTNKTLDIEHGESKLYRCSYTQYVSEKEKYRKEYEKRYELQQREIARIEAYIEQQRRWNRERNIIAAESREKALARMVKIEKPKSAPRSIHFRLTSSGESGNDVADIRNLTMGYGDNLLFKDLSFLVKKRDRLFVSGPNGCGKSTLIKILTGSLEPLSGTVEFGYNVTVGYYDQENQNLTEENTVLDELWDSYPNLTQTEIRNTLASFMFRGDDIEKKVSVLSGGERARLTLAKLILSRMNVLILDEPTNHLDIDSREVLENALAAFEGTIIAVSHDRYFTKRLATKFLDLGNGGELFIGGWDAYQDYLQRRSLKPQPERSTAPDSRSVEYTEKKKSQAEKRKREKRKAEIAREISKLEKEIVEIEDLLFGEAATDYQRVSELTDRKIQAEDILMSLYEEEEELENADG